MILLLCFSAASFVFAFPFSEANAQGGSVFGIVIGPSPTNQPRVSYFPVEGAVVELKGPKGGFNTLSDNQGGFQFTKIPAGDYVLSVHKPGYGGYVRQISIKDAQTINSGHITLLPEGGLTTHQEIIPPDTVYAAFATLEDDHNSPPTSLEYLRHFLFSDDPLNEGGNRDDRINPYEKEHQITIHKNALMIIDPKDLHNINYIKLKASPVWLCFNISGTKLYAADNDKNVHIYDVLNNHAHTGTIRLSSPATDLVLAPKGQWLFISHSDGITVVDTSNHTPVNLIEMPVMSNGHWGSPMALAVSSDEKTFYAALGSSDFGEVIAIDVYTRQPTARAIVGAFPTDLSITPDGSRLFAANHNSAYVSILSSADVSILSAEPLRVIDRIGIEVSPTKMAITSDSSKVYITCKGSDITSVIAASTGKSIKSINVGREPMGIAIAADNSKLYVANNGDRTISIIDINADLEIKRTKPQPFSRPFGIIVKP